jgi:hypothetical protein
MSPSRLARPPLVVLRIALLTALLLLTVGGVVLPVTVLLAWCRGEAVPPAAAVSAGVICALTTWLFVAVFHLRRETISLPVDDAPAFARRLRSHLEELGYVVAAPADGRVVGRPSFQALLFGGKVQARIENGTARLTGPRVYVEVLRKRLRLHTHLERVPCTLASLRHRHGEPMLRAAQIRLEVPGELLTAIYREIAAVLAREGASIRCELAIHATSAGGLRDLVIETGIHEWLKEQQVPVEIHKEPLQPALATSPN